MKALPTSPIHIPHHQSLSFGSEYDSGFCLLALHIAHISSNIKALKRPVYEFTQKLWDPQQFTTTKINMHSNTLAFQATFGTVHVQSNRPLLIIHGNP